MTKCKYFLMRSFNLEQWSFEFKHKMSAGDTKIITKAGELQEPYFILSMNIPVSENP